MGSIHVSIAFSMIKEYSLTKKSQETGTPAARPDVRWLLLLPAKLNQVDGTICPPGKVPNV